MIAGATGNLMDKALKTQITQVQFVYKGIDGPDWIIFCNVFVEPFGKQSALASVFAFNETLDKNLELL